MTFRLATIVEGDGEVQALPVLMRRVASWRSSELSIEVLKPIRVRRDRFLSRVDEFTKHVHLARAKAGTLGGVLILLDADDDCPVLLARRVSSQAGSSGMQPLQVVIANREFESWFAACAPALAGCRGFEAGVEPPDDPDRGRDAKGWIRRHTARREYSPVADQAAFAAAMDLDAAHAKSRSFRKLVASWDALAANAARQSS